MYYDQNPYFFLSGGGGSKIGRGRKFQNFKNSCGVSNERYVNSDSKYTLQSKIGRCTTRGKLWNFPLHKFLF